MSEEHEKLVTDCNGLNTKPIENVNSEKVIYNNAKMREALEHVKKLAREFAVGNYYVSDFPKMLLDAIQPALAEPPRNCDLVKNFYDAQKRFLRETGELIVRDEIYDWLFAKAKGGNNE